MRPRERVNLMANSKEIINEALKRIRQLPKRTAQEELVRQQEFIRGSLGYNTTSTGTTGWDGKQGVDMGKELAKAALMLPPIRPWGMGLKIKHTFSLQDLDANINEFIGCGGICQPHRPEVLRKTVNSTIVEPKALPAGKEVDHEELKGSS